MPFTTVNFVSIMPNVNDVEPKIVGNGLQKIIQEVNNLIVSSTFYFNTVQKVIFPTHRPDYIHYND